MAEAVDLHIPTTTRRRRSSLAERGLPPQYLQALEEKRRLLDDSIHKYIASKEREFKSFEKELKIQAKRSEDERQQDKALSPVMNVAQKDGRSKIHDSTSQADFGLSTGSRKIENFPGVFTPEFLTALEYPAIERASSAPAPGTGITQTPPPLPRTSSDSVAQDLQRPSRLLLQQRTSSSGSSADGKLISAMKSTTEAPRSQKRVSLAVGDSIVAPSDNVPVNMNVKSSSSHSRQRSINRELRAQQKASASIQSNNATHEKANISAAVQVLQEQGSLIAANCTDSLRKAVVTTQEDDIGDMFDLEDEDIDTPYNTISSEISPEDNMDNEIAGRVNKALPTSDGEDSDILLGEPPPDGKSSPDTENIVLSESVGSSKQPLSPGFKRPSAMKDPSASRGYKRIDFGEGDGSFYGSSFSRSSKGSFTSSSLGESYMAKNAEKLLEARAQQRQSQHTTSHVMAVR